MAVNVAAPFLVKESSFAGIHLHDTYFVAIIDSCIAKETAVGPKSCIFPLFQGGGVLNSPRRFQ